MIHVIQGFGRRRRGRLFDQDAIARTFDSMERSPIAPRPGPAAAGRGGREKTAPKRGWPTPRSWAAGGGGSRSVGLEIESIWRRCETRDAVAIESAPIDISEEATMARFGLRDRFRPASGQRSAPGPRGTRGGVASCSNHSSSAGEGGLAIGRTKANASQTVSGRTLNNAGAATLASQSPGYGLSVSDGATLNNASGASFTFIADASIQDGGGTPRGGRSTTTAPWSRPAGAVPAPSASP